MNWIKNHSWLINLGLIIISIIFSLLFVEFFLRITGQREQPRPDPLLGQIGLPGNGRDQAGFRNDFSSTSATIFAIGDSQTDGNNAPTNKDTWPHQLEKIIDQPVYQMAFSGYGPVQYKVLLDRVLPLKPEMIMVGFYFGNDLNDVFRAVYQDNTWSSLRNRNFKVATTVENRESDIRLMLQSGYEEDSWGLKILRFRRWCRAKSRLYSLLGDGTRALREKINLASTKEEEDQKIVGWAQNNPLKALAVQEAGIETILSPLYRYDTIDLGDPKNKEAWRITKNLFSLMEREAREAGCRFSIIIIPTKELIYGQYFRNKGEAVSSSMKNYLEKEEELLSEVMNFCQKEKINCFSVAEEMSFSLEKRQAIYPTSMDGHPIARGYLVIAQSVAGFLRANNLLD